MNILQHLLVAVIRFYRWTISPVKSAFFGPWGHCRYSPTCSAYALEAVQLHGVWRGTCLAARRLLRCHPWGGCGHDPVPHVTDAAPRSSPANAPNASNPACWITTEG